MSGNFFRFAEKKDCNLILDFITKLGVYEKLEHEVVATEELLSKWIFDEKKAEVIFVLDNNKEVGFALFFSSFSTFLGKAGLFLEDLFVLEEYRGKGFGKALLQELKRIAISRDCGRFEWNCLDWNKPSIDFYESMNAKQMTGWIGFRLDKENLK